MSVKNLQKFPLNKEVKYPWILCSSIWCRKSIHGDFYMWIFDFDFLNTGGFLNFLYFMTISCLYWRVYMCEQIQSPDARHGPGNVRILADGQCLLTVGFLVISSGQVSQDSLRMSSSTSEKRAWKFSEYFATPSKLPVYGMWFALFSPLYVRRDAFFSPNFRIMYREFIHGM